VFGRESNGKVYFLILDKGDLRKYFLMVQKFSFMRSPTNTFLGIYF